ncbi:MAG TPA: hypothetical protein DIT58_04700 [Porticoccaceae bacterium]|nr:hypothetical protein [Porticoccaceae bacterium]
MRRKLTWQSGFTLIEMMITVAVVAVVLGVAVPSFQDFFDKNRVKRAAEEVYGLMAKARSEAVTRDSDMIVTINSGAWCVGYTDGAVACDCTVTDPDTANACSVPVAGTNVLQVVDGSGFNGVTMSQETFGGALTYNRVRGTAGNGTVQFTSGAWSLDVRGSVKGRVRICAAASKTMGYEGC